MLHDFWVTIPQQQQTFYHKFYYLFLFIQILDKKLELHQTQLDEKENNNSRLT